MAEVKYEDNDKKDEVVAEVKPEEAPKSSQLRPDVEFKLPDGRVIRMGKPAVPSAMLLPSIIASMTDPDKKSDPARNEFNSRMCLFVRSIDGKPMVLPSSAAEVGLIMQQLGEDGCDLALDVYFNHFAPLSSSQLEIIKK
jgi:hypothetical protein